MPFDKLPITQEALSKFMFHSSVGLRGDALGWRRNNEWVHKLKGIHRYSRVHGSLKIKTTRVEQIKVKGFATYTIIISNAVIVICKFGGASNVNGGRLVRKHWRLQVSCAVC